MYIKKRTKNRNRKKDECSRCSGEIELTRIKSGQKFCNKCQAEYLRIHRPKYTELSDFQKLKVYARNRANQAIRRGKIVKEPCCICGSLKSEMHHDDYNKPFDVKWLCREHHMEYHKNNPNVL